MYDVLKLEALTNKLIQKYYIAGLDCLSEVNVSDDRKKQLLIYTEELMNREKFIKFVALFLAAIMILSTGTALLQIFL